MFTALSNRVGDVLFILALISISQNISYSPIDLILSTDDLLYKGLFVASLLVLGSITKSGVMPFSAWLPEAMAAPTPVSSLVHSSTLVTAGVYVLIRFSDLTSYACEFCLIIFAMVTMIIAGIRAVVITDMKKVVALSTLSQIRLIMLSVRMGAIGIAFFHLLVHAFFKALMFICVGSVIFYSGGVQDARFLGSL